jgi:hypothetical protein
MSRVVAPRAAYCLAACMLARPTAKGQAAAGPTSRFEAEGLPRGLTFYAPRVRHPSAPWTEGSSKPPRTTGTLPRRRRATPTPCRARSSCCSHSQDLSGCHRRRETAPAFSSISRSLHCSRARRVHAWSSRLVSIWQRSGAPRDLRLLPGMTLVADMYF